MTPTVESPLRHVESTPTSPFRLLVESTASNFAPQQQTATEHCAPTSIHDVKKAAEVEKARLAQLSASSVSSKPAATQSSSSSSSVRASEASAVPPQTKSGSKRKSSNNQLARNMFTPKVRAQIKESFMGVKTFCCRKAVSTSKPDLKCSCGRFLHARCLTAGFAPTSAQLQNPALFECPVCRTCACCNVTRDPLQISRNCSDCHLKYLPGPEHVSYCQCCGVDLK